MGNSFRGIRSSNLVKNIVPFRPQISRRDLDRGVIWRYFVSRANQAHVEANEVSPKHYDSFVSNSAFVCEKLRWVITGPLDDSTLSVYIGEENKEDIIIPGARSQNKASIETAAKNLPALRQILSPTQYYLG